MVALAPVIKRSSPAWRRARPRGAIAYNIEAVSRVAGGCAYSTAFGVDHMDVCVSWGWVFTSPEGHSGLDNQGVKGTSHNARAFFFHRVCALCL